MRRCLRDEAEFLGLSYGGLSYGGLSYGGLSYGFRPGRGRHDALDALTVGIETRNIDWVLDADIARFFDTISHE